MNLMSSLTNSIVKRIDSGIQDYHDVFGSGRCPDSKLEEIALRAIHSDINETKQVHAMEVNGGFSPCIAIQDSKKVDFISIMYGDTDERYLNLSRIGLAQSIKIQHLSGGPSEICFDIIGFTNEVIHESSEMINVYSIWHISADFLQNFDCSKCEESGKQIYINNYGAVLEIKPTYSRQLTLKIPLKLVQKSKMKIQCSNYQESQWY